MNNFLLILGALLVGILAALVAVPMVIDWNSYRGVFEEEATRLMGRDVRVGGGVNVRILPVPYVRFEKLRIADTASTGGDPLFRADSVTMQLSIAPLLRGVLEAKSVELKRPLLRLAVDAEGRGNWRTLALKAGTLPFVPADVALQSVGIEDGRLIIAGAGAKDLAEIGSIAGELSADSFDGPYKFKGTATWGGAPREVRLSTAKPDADGGVRLRANIHIPTSETNYAFDGRMLDLQGRPRLDGDVTAKLSLQQAGQKPSAAGADTLDVKAKFSGDLKSGDLTGIEISRDDPADAQLVTGSAKLAWNNAVSVDMALSARTFNLDRLAPGAPGSDPLETARTALAVALSGLPAEAETTATYKAEKVLLHGESLTGVTVAVGRHGGDIEVRTLKATLPGATRLLASGVLTTDQKQPAFTGPVSLRGGNLARFLAWSRKAAAASPTAPGDAPPSRYDGPFAVEGQLAMNGARFELTRATAELSGYSVAGELRLALEGRRSVGLVLDGERIEATQIWPGGFNPADLKAYLTGALPAAEVTRLAAKPSGTGFFGFDPETTDLSVQVRAGEVQLTTTALLKAVDTTFAVTRGKLAIQRLRFTTQEGLALDIDGELTGLAATPLSVTPTPADPRGTMRFIVDAATPQAVVALLNAIDWPQPGRPGEAAMASVSALGPVHLAGSTGLSESRPRALDITVDGTVDGGRLTARGHLDAGLHAWAVAPMELSASIETVDTARWLAIAGLQAPATGAPAAARPGRIVLSSAGTPRSGVSTFAELSTDRMNVRTRGTATVSPGFDVSFSGSSTVDARDVTEALALAGLVLGQGPSELPFAATVRFANGPGGVTLATSDGRLGPPAAPSGITGLVVVKPAAAPTSPREIAATIALDQATLPGLLTSISDRRQQGQAAARWPEQPLKLPAGLAGRIDLTLGRLVIEGPVAATGVTAALLVKPDGVHIDALMAHALGGTLKAAIDLKPESGGTTFAGTLGLTGADLAALAPSAQAPLSLVATLKGQGLSASALIASLTGTGEAILGGGQIKGVAPAAVAGLLDIVLASKDPVAGEALGDALRQSLAASSLPITPQKVPFAVAFGTLKLPPFAARTLEGRSTLEGALDLAALKYTLDWRIEAASKPAPSGALKPPLSAVRLTSEGLVATLPAVETKLSLGSFEQEIVVRKMEHDTEELERLRKLDEDRRKQDEAARLKAAEAAAARIAAPAAASGAQPLTPDSPQMPDAAPASDAQRAPQGPPAAGPGTAVPQAPAQANAPGQSQVRHRPQGAPPQASGIPQPFGSPY